MQTQSGDTTLKETDPDDADGDPYIIQTSFDAGRTIYLAAMMSDGTDSCVVTSDKYVHVAGGNQSFGGTLAVDVSGTAKVGVPLTAAPSGLSESDVTYTYEWKRGTTVVGTNASYTPVAADAGGTLTVTVTASKTGYDDAVASKSTATVATGDFTGTAGFPTIGATAKVGEQLTATPDDGTLSPTPDGHTYRWYAGGVEIANATDSSFTPTAAESGKVITVRVRATAPGYNDSDEAESAPTTGVEDGDFTSAPVPTVTGTAEVGSILTAHAGTWTPSAALTYQWYRDNDPIGGADAADYTLTADDLGHDVRVKVTGVLTGYNSAEKASVPVSVAAGTLTTHTPVLSGLVVKGQTLSITMADWSPVSVYSYQWYRRDGGVDTEITGATGSSYELTGDDVGKKVWVKVSGTAAGYTAADASSAYSDTVLGTFSATGTPTITGDLSTGGVLTAHEDGDNWSPTPTSYTYVWNRDGGAINGADGPTYTLAPGDVAHNISVTVTAHAAGYAATNKTSAQTATVTAADFTTHAKPTIDDTAPVVDQTVHASVDAWDPAVGSGTWQWYADGDPIDQATSADYTVTASTLGKALTVKYTGTRDGYNDKTETSGATDVVAKADFGSHPAPTIDDTTPAVGQTLHASVDPWTPAATGGTWQWYAGGSLITGATGSTYVVKAADLDKEITVTYTGTRAGYNDVTETSAYTWDVVKGDFTSTGYVGIVGDHAGDGYVGDTLTASTSGWSVVPTPEEFDFQWYRDGVAITDADVANYELTAADIGHQITVKVTAVLDGYTSVDKTSEEITAAAKADFGATPKPTIDDTTPTVGDTLTATKGTWVPNPSSDDVSYQWYVGGTPVGGAVGATYQVAPGDVGRTITVKVTGTKVGYNPATVESDPTVAVAAAVLTGMATPTISGEAKVGQTLTATGVTTGVGLTPHYQWYAGTGAITGAVGETYTVGADDLGKAVTVEVTYSKTGYTDSVKTSEATAEVVAGTLAAPAAPTITGVAKVGGTLTAAGLVEGLTPAFQWFVDGVAVDGATGSTYTVGVADLGKAVTVGVTYSKDGYNETAQVVSEDTDPVVVGTLSGVAAPVVAGTAQVDETLTVAGQAGLRAAAFRRTVASASGVGVAYQWFVAGQPVAGATGTSYTARAADLGRTVTVRATYTRTGYADAVRESAATSPVAPGDWKVTAKTRITADSVSAVGGTMTASDPTLSKAADGFRYQWSVGGTVIAGATGRSIVNDAAFAGELLTVRVTAVRAGYPDVVSEATNIHRIGAFWITSKPGISGTVKVGRKVRAVTGGWAPAATGYSYQWLVNGKKIAGATKSTYKVPAKYRGKKLSVKVTAKASGYTLDATATSSTKVIR